MRIHIPTPSDFSFLETVAAHGWRRLAPFAWDEDAQSLTHISELSDGRVAAAQITAGLDAVFVDTEGDGDPKEIEARVRRMLQLDLALGGFHAFCRARPELCHIVDRRQGRLLRSPTLFEDAVKVIATSNTTWTQTVAMTARLVERFGAPLPRDPARRAFPTPQRLASVPFAEFAAHARMGYRNAYVYQIAASIAGGALDLETWQDEGLPADILRKRLLSLPGIGPYGTSCLMLYLGKPEHVNADSWARMLLSKELGRSVTDKEVHAFFADYGEWRGLVYNFYHWKHSQP
jgi:3-methyladenine DNA glycosylase/8-oxoguanine DNA glycosylase